MVIFAAVGAFGALLNLLIMAALIGIGAHYLVASIVATELTILSNFLLHERFVFHDRLGSRPFIHRLLASFGFNNVETLVRIPVLMVLVTYVQIHSIAAQAVTLAAAFILRFAFTSSVIYRKRPETGLPLAAAPTEERSA